MEDSQIKTKTSAFQLCFFFLLCLTVQGIADGQPGLCLSNIKRRISGRTRTLRGDIDSLLLGTDRADRGRTDGERHHDGTEDPVDPDRGDHPFPGEERRELLPWLQGESTEPQDHRLAFYLPVLGVRFSKCRGCKVNGERTYPQDLFIYLS